MAPPMPPVAPVTSAVLPVKSNMIALPLARSCAGHRRFESRDIFGRAYGARADAFRDPSDETAEHLAGAYFIKRVGARARHRGNGLAPAHRAGDLSDERAHDFGGIVNGPRQNIGDHRHRGRS